MSVPIDIAGIGWVSLLVPVSSVPPAPLTNCCEIVKIKSKPKEVLYLCRWLFTHNFVARDSLTWNIVTRNIVARSFATRNSVICGTSWGSRYLCAAGMALCRSKWRHGCWAWQVAACAGIYGTFVWQASRFWHCPGSGGAPPSVRRRGCLARLVTRTVL